MRTVLTLSLALLCSSPALAQDSQPATDEPVLVEEPSSWEKTKTASGDAWEATKDATKHGWEATKEGSGKAWEATKETSGEAWEATKEGSEKAWEATKETSGEAWEATKEGSGKAWDATKETSGEAWEATKEGTEKAWDATEGAFGAGDDEANDEAAQTNDANGWITSVRHRGYWPLRTHVPHPEPPVAEATSQTVHRRFLGQVSALITGFEGAPGYTATRVACASLPRSSFLTA